MANSKDGSWDKEIIANRVTVSKNANILRMSIKAPEFVLGNNFLTLCITVGVSAEIVLTYLMIKSNVSLALLVPGFFVLAGSLGIAFVKFWLWHNFGEELLKIRGNSCELSRNYGLFKSSTRELILNEDSEIFTNRNDKWSWLEFRSKGIFRLATVNTNLADFGVNLDDKEFEMILRSIADQLNSFKKKQRGLQSAIWEKAVEDPQITIENLNPTIEEETQPPNLAQQTDGQHRNDLNDYLGKVAGDETVEEPVKSKTKDKENT